MAMDDRIIFLWVNLGPLAFSIHGYILGWICSSGYRTEYDGTLPVIILLLITAITCWKRQKGHAIFGFVLSLLWATWMALPRL